MTPASLIVGRFGSASTVAEVTGVHRTRVYNWLRAKELGGSGGRIPQSHHLRLLEAARERGIPLTAAELIGDMAEAA
jgi:transposase